MGGVWSGLHRIFRAAFEEYVYGGHIAGTALLGIILTFGFLKAIQDNGPFLIDYPLLVMAYFTPVIVYSYDHYRDLRQDMRCNPDRAHYLEKKERYYKYIILAYIVILFASIVVGDEPDWLVAIFITILVGGGLLYASTSKYFTKYVPAYKNIYVSLEWAVAGTFLFEVYNQSPISALTLLMFLFIFLKYMTNTIFCDLKDIDTDRERGLKTVPVMIGYENTIGVLCCLSGVALFPIVYGVSTGSLPAAVLLFTVFALYDLTYILSAYKNKGSCKLSTYGFFADFEITLWPIIIIPTVLILQDINIF
jgi:4-hydroxybenzoate polyprenyltransferase